MFPVARELLEHRLAISQTIRAQIAPIAKTLQQLTPEARRAVFLKLESERTITQQDLGGTGLKILAVPAPNETLVVPRDGDVTAFEDTVRKFGETELKKNTPPPSAKLVSSLSTVGMGNPRDRLSPEMRERYARLIRAKTVTFELEIVTFEVGSKNQRRDLLSQVSKLTGTLGNGVRGRVFECDYGETGVRVCLWTSGTMLRQFVEGAEWQQVIGLFEFRPHFETFHTTVRDFQFETLGPISAPEADAPIICVIDSGVAPGNPFLAPVVRKDLCRSYLPGRSADLWDELGHGSGVASLAAYYAISLAKGATHKANAWIASARVLNANGYLDDITSDEADIAREREARLLSSILRDVVRDFKSHGVRIFVFAFNVLNRIWNKDGQRVVPRASWLARTIDKISRDEDVIFVTITGNLDAHTVRDLHQSAPYPTYFSENEVRIQDPGQASLSVTIGSVAHSASTTGSTGEPLAAVGQPSPFTRLGPGLGGSIKPDFVERGGNSVYDPGLKAVIPNLQTDVIMASHQISPPISHGCGASFAAPRAGYHLAKIEHDLKQLAVPNFSSNLMRALLASCASYDHLHAFDWFKQNFEGKDWFNVIGYGLPDGSSALDCDEHNPVLFFDGAILPDRVALFSLPLPPELANAKSERRIAISLAYAPPIQQYGLQAYHGVAVKFRLFSGDKPQRAIQDAMSLDDGEENVLKEQQDDFGGGVVGINRRSRGSLQHEVLRIYEYPTEWTTHPFTLAVSLTQKWGGTTKPVPLAVVIRIQDVRKAASRLYTPLAEALAKARTRARV